MKQGIHPEVQEVLYRCANCKHAFIALSTKTDAAKREHEGKEYPSVTLEICSECHPFFTGKQIFVDTAGRVEKFRKRYAAK
jgi:large subunit ribosomal protein L31